MPPCGLQPRPPRGSVPEDCPLTRQGGAVFLLPESLYFLICYLNPPGCGALFLQRAAGAPLQKADRIPLALSQFSLRATARPCENWSAAPAAVPCIIHWMRSPPLPLLRLAASAAGSASAAQPAAHRCGPGPAGPPRRGSERAAAPSSGGCAAVMRWALCGCKQPAPRRSSFWFKAPVKGRARRAGVTAVGGGWV